MYWLAGQSVGQLVDKLASQSVGLSVILYLHLRMLESYQLVYKVEKI